MTTTMKLWRVTVKTPVVRGRYAAHHYAVMAATETQAQWLAADYMPIAEGWTISTELADSPIIKSSSTTHRVVT